MERTSENHTSTMNFLNQILFEKQQKAEDTDCSFVFQIPSQDGHASKKKQVVAHKLVLGAVSPYFEANFKTEWEKNQPIPITTVDYDVFVKLLEIVYLNEVTLTTLDEGTTLYEAAHFYLMTDVLKLLRAAITKYWFSNKTTQIAQFLNTAYTLQDWILLEFFAKVFHSNISKILHRLTSKLDAEWFNYHPSVINYLFSSCYGCSAIDNATLKSALEAYVTHNKESYSMDVFKPTLESKELHANISNHKFVIGTSYVNFDSE